MILSLFLSFYNYIILRRLSIIITTYSSYSQLGKIGAVHELFSVHNNYLLLIKTFTVNNNYLRLIKLFAVNFNCLPLIEIFAVNNSYLPLIKIFTVNKTICC